VHRANRRQAEIIEQLHTKRANNADPNMSNAPTWMAHALKVANKVIEQGEGDLSAMGEFADVECKVGVSSGGCVVPRSWVEEWAWRPRSSPVSD
jgi:hypothetical protein